jgi:hypothetical protein
MKKILYMSLVTSFLFLFCMISVCFTADEDPCKDQGITVRNLSYKDIWYKREGGSCTIVKRNYSFTMKPEEEISLFSDSVCQTPYCPECTYTYLKAYDANGDCRVKILPDNTISDI